MPDQLGGNTVDSMDNEDPRQGFINASMIGDKIAENNGFNYDPLTLFDDHIDNSMLPYDL